ncbi:nucleoside triphosphate pyrophosphohydrolase [Lysinibacillus sp. BW-2-10]|uniref:nucleoside triphosphate pyrophosphohydrolase n=1 Tax=Lysinibacillus sp. BW-2-10 TaxID=2590030 RepID=UPI00118064A6|nr:nucleoside triphosphate pyrophosphohydrolase [Lysinibacillus sp. BW-2-10]TSI05106.1 phosphoribosyl-ATP pyrophosphohydrolase [Lysinibacillus sp. BW-2-10]
MPTYNKLVRDQIIDIIEKDGLHCNYRILNEQEHLQEIKKKFYEEVKEYEQTSNETDALEELADLLELIHAALSVHNKSFDDLETVRRKKLEQRGGFQKRLFLIDVEDE